MQAAPCANPPNPYHSRIKMARVRKRVATQLPLPLPVAWGGRRRGAGRPRRSDESVPHAARPVITARTPVHVTLRVCRGVWNLRSERSFAKIQRTLTHERDVARLRVVAFSVQGNHVHMIVECDSATDLSRRMKGFGARFAKGMNRLMGRTHGKVLAERYHAVVLRSPTQVKNALLYVIHNHVRHATRAGWTRPPPVDRFSGASVAPLARGSPDLVSTPRAWVLRGALGPAVGTARSHC